MPKTCLSCKAVALKEVPSLSCGACRAAVYCSRVCQKKDWKEHKKICMSLNVGEGAMQVGCPAHVQHCIELKGVYEQVERSLDEGGRRFFKLFAESTFEGSKAAARKMKKIAARHTKHNQKVLLFHTLYPLILTDCTDSEKLLVLLQFVDPSIMLSGNEYETLQEGSPDTLLSTSWPFWQTLKEATTQSRKTNSYWGDSLSNTAPTSTLSLFQTAIRPCTLHVTLPL
jgi:hypothetical protein